MEVQYSQAEWPNRFGSAADQENREKALQGLSHAADRTPLHYQYDLGEAPRQGARRRVKSK